MPRRHISMDGDGVGIGDDSIEDRLRYGVAAKLIVPAFRAELRAEDGRRPAVAVFEKL